MNWIEIIRLRLAAGGNEAAWREIMEYAGPAVKEDKFTRIRIYRDAHLYTDLSVHLVHSSCLTDIHRSPLGLRIAASFEELGLVDHSVWIREEER